MVQTVGQVEPGHDLFHTVGPDDRQGLASCPANPALQGHISKIADMVRVEMRQEQRFGVTDRHAHQEEVGGRTRTGIDDENALAGNHHGTRRSPCRVRQG